MSSILEQMLEEVQTLKNKDIKQNIEDRLEKTLNKYLDELDYAVDEIKYKKSRKLNAVVKGLSKNENKFN